jgi:hypothetical protein
MAENAYGADKPNPRKMTFLLAAAPLPPRHQSRYAPAWSAATARTVPADVPASAVPGPGRRPGRPVPARDGRPPDGGERRTTRPAHGSDQASSPQPPARPRNRRAGSAGRGDDEDDLKDWVKKVVDDLPPLTDEQRDLLALIFRSNHRR